MTLSNDAFRLDGRLALVTGAARGLGAAIARGFGAYGARLALCDRDGEGLAAVAAELRDAGVEVSTETLDVRNRGAIDAWVATLGPIHVLVNNAGGTFHSSFLDVSDNGQQSIIDVNFTSVTNFVRACVPSMPAGSSIVNITSVEAYKASPGFAVYGAMKAAVEHLSRSLALELSDRRIRVNTIAPDALPTPGDAGLLVGTDDYGAKLALGWGESDDIAGAAVYLAADASRFVTGTTVHVDGGSDAARGWRKTSEGWWP
jgi:3-oxoacyl-[acyl-carrier protein] reductase